MSKTISSKAIAFLFLLLLSSSFLLSMARDAPDVDGATKLSKNKPKGGKKFRKSGLDILSEAADILAAFGGETVEQMMDDLKGNLKQTDYVLQMAKKPSTMRSINFFIRSLILGFGEAARQAASENDSSMTMQASDFSEFLNSFKTIVMKRCKAEPSFSTGILPQIEAAMPLILQGLTEMYENVMATTGFGLTFGLLSQSTMLLSFLDREEYIAEDTFSSFNFLEEIKGYFEQAFEQFMESWNIDTTQVDMVLNMAKMYATSVVNNRHHEKEEL